MGKDGVTGRAEEVPRRGVAIRGNPMVNMGRILVADDDETFRQSTAELLRREGYRCDCTSGAESALEKLRTTSYDLLIADIKMPGKSGLDLVAELPRIAFDIPAIVVTGYPSLDSAVWSVGMDVAAYLVKPLDFEQLLRHVRETMGKIMERQRSEASSSIYVEQWKLVLESVRDPVCLLSPEGRIIGYNQAVEELVGKRPLDGIGNYCHDLLLCDKNPTSECPLVLAQRSHRRESALVKQEDRWFDHVVQPLLDETGELIGAVHIVGGITGRRRPEEALYDVAQGFSAVTGKMFFRSLVQYLGSALKFDFAFVAELTGTDHEKARTLAICADGEIGEDFEYELRNSPLEDIESARPCTYPGRVQQQFPDDAVLAERNIGSFVGAPLCDSAGRAIGLMVVASREPLTDPNLTESMLQVFAGQASVELERKRTEEALRERESELRQSQKMEEIGKLAGEIAWDFNNQLKAITGYSELVLSRAEVNSRVRDHMERIREAGNMGLSLTRQLQALSSKQPLQKMVMNLNVALTGMEKLLRGLLDENVELCTVVGPGTACVKASPEQVGQIVMNLVVNARDAMPDGGTITIKTECVTMSDDSSERTEARSGKFVRLSVSDTGVGMEKAIADRIFEPFFSTKSPESGTGLGLATVHRIVKQHGGWIGVESSPGQGSTFQVHLPAVNED